MGGDDLYRSFSKKEICKIYSTVLKLQTDMIRERKKKGEKIVEYLLQTKALTKRIRGRDLVRGIDIHVKKGEIYGFIGPNGAGKSTVMKMITNLWKPTSGFIEIFGERLMPFSYDVFRKMSSIIEFPTFYDHMSGIENLRLHCEYMGYYCPGSIDEVLDVLGLSDAADRPVKSYSLGMKQRLGIARAILGRPELLILDEPTNGLDPAGMKQIRRLLRSLCTEYGITMMISTHILSEIEPIADSIGVIAKGKMRAEVSMKEIRDRHSVYIYLKTNALEQTAYLLSDRLGLTNFRVMDDGGIRIYEEEKFIPEISKMMSDHGVTIINLQCHCENLEDYFLKMTGGEMDV